MPANIQKGPVVLGKPFEIQSVVEATISPIKAYIAAGGLVTSLESGGVVTL